jgi:hypothetical protein
MDQYFAIVNRLKAIDTAQQCRFSGTRRPNQADDVMLFDCHRQAFYNGHLTVRL